MPGVAHGWRVSWVQAVWGPPVGAWAVLGLVLIPEAGPAAEEGRNTWARIGGMAPESYSPDVECAWMCPWALGVGASTFPA